MRALQVGRMTECRALAEEMRSRLLLVPDDDRRKMLLGHFEWLIEQVVLLRGGIEIALQESSHGDVMAELRATRRDFDRSNRKGQA